MKTLIAQATIIDRRHPDNGKKKDLLIDDGIIAKIEDRLDVEADEIVEAEGLCVSIGWMDMRANYRDPGEEYKEGLVNGLKVAAKGGFTAVALSPDTTPPIDNKGAVEYLRNRSKGTGVEVVPIGAVSQGLKGENMSEMYDMFLAGARGFGDDKHALAESGLLKRALLYTANFDAPVFHFPFDSRLLPNGQINEGALSTSLGLKGIPSISEEMVVRRDLTLLEYTGGKLHLGPLSSHRSIEFARKAKKQGLEVSTEVSAAHFVFNENELHDFDTTFKLMPPLRGEKNQDKLIRALQSGEIDVISSDHAPEDIENKKLEFDLAAFGMATQEIFFPMLFERLGGEVQLDELVSHFSINPRSILGMEIPQISEGEKANLTLFSVADKTGTDDSVSKAYNSPNFSDALKGKVIRTFSSF